MNGTNCDKCMTGYSPRDVDQCPKCDCDFCGSCMKNHGC